jgi:hypothetical protein
MRSWLQLSRGSSPETGVVTVDRVQYLHQTLFSVVLFYSPRVYQGRVFFCRIAIVWPLSQNLLNLAVAGTSRSVTIKPSLAGCGVGVVTLMQTLCINYGYINCRYKVWV